MKKFILSLLVVGALAGVATKPAAAAEMKPLSAVMTSLGTASALSYYTVEGKDFHVVTLVQLDGDEVGHPLTFKNSLRSGQSVVLSVPRGVNERPASLWIARVGNQLLIGPRTTVASN